MVSNPETPEPTMAGVVKTVLTFVVGADRKMSRVAVRATSRVDVIKISLVPPNPPRMSR